MLKLSEPEVRELGIRGYVMVRDVIPPAQSCGGVVAVKKSSRSKTDSGEGPSDCGPL